MEESKCHVSREVEEENNHLHRHFHSPRHFFSAILGLKYLQYGLYYANNIGDTGLRGLSAAIAAVVGIINLGLTYLITLLTMAEKHDTESSYFRSLMTKIMIAGQVNTNLLVIFAHILVYRPVQAIYARGTLS